MSYVSKGMTSSADETWATPQAVFDALDAVWHFTLDVAASPTNAKCPRYFTEQDDALVQNWGREVCWCNPPYGAKLPAFVHKARLAAEQGATVVLLIPARTDTRYWHEHVIPYASSIHFVKGRLRPLPFRRCRFRRRSHGRTLRGNRFSGRRALPLITQTF